jgi:hypothetical protein
MRFRRSIALCALVLFAAAAPAGAAAAPYRDPALPDVQHVWIVVLENKNYEDTFGPDTEAPYLARELTRAGQLLPNYFGTSHASLGNYITLVSGQAPNADTQGDCQIYRDVLPGVVAPDGQVVGQGCVYPKEAKTIANQLDDAGLRWRGYMEDMGNTPGAPRTCRHPAIGAQDETQSARANDQYAVRHNPFVYFHSIIDGAGCDANVVPLDQLAQDVQRPETTPNFAFITPDLCSDGHDASCADGGPGGLQAADAFLRRWVPVIVGSPGFADHGLLIVTWDEANLDKTDACCDEPTGPNTPSPGVTGAGGGRTGTVLISPFVRPGSVNETSYNHYALLRSVEDLFGLGHLGYAARDGLKPFGADVYDAAATPTAPPATHTRCHPAHRGKAVAGLRLRGRLLTFRARRTARVRLTARNSAGHGRRLRRPRRIVACRTYSLKVPKGTRVVTVRGAGHLQRVRRGPSGEHG